MVYGVVLPILEEVLITNVPLYSQPVPLRLFPGLNVILGVNGLGKTTTVKIALIGILGAVAQDQAVQSIVSDASDVPTVRVKFKVGTDVFDVERNLRTNKVVEFRLIDSDGVISALSNFGSVDPNNAYEERLTSLTGTGNAENLYFLLSRLIFREEEAEHLLWDAANQHRVLRLLFCGGDFEARWKAAFDQSVNDDTKFRQHREFLRRDEEARKRVEQDLDETKQRLEVTLASVATTGRPLAQVREEIQQLTAKQQSVDTELRQIESHQEVLRAERHQHALKRDELSVELDHLDATFHEKVYKDFSVLGMAARRLRHRAVCVFCDRNVSDELRDHLINTKLNTDACPFCEQSLGPASTSAVDANRLDRLVTEEQELTHAVTEFDKRLSALARQAMSLRENLSSIAPLLQQAHSAFIAGSDGGLSPVLLQDKIGQFEGTLTHFEERRLAEVERLTTLDEVRTASRKMLMELEQELAKVSETESALFNEIFGQFSEELLGRHVPLELVETKAKGQQKNYMVFQPVLDTKRRQRARETATHERFLLDYAFRLAALTYYTDRSGQPAFFAIEPAEGTMDPVYASHLALTLHKFAHVHENQTLLLIANLRSVDFIRELYGDLPLDERRKRTVDFRTYGKLKGLQVKEHSKYDDIWTAIFRP